jgi:hypothetical protein
VGLVDRVAEVRVAKRATDDVRQPQPTREPGRGEDAERERAALGAVERLPLKPPAMAVERVPVVVAQRAARAPVLPVSQLEVEQRGGVGRLEHSQRDGGRVHAWTVRPIG